MASLPEIPIFGQHSVATSILLGIVCFATIFNIMGCFGRTKWDPKGKHVYITGGSTGLGLHVAIHLARLGANITIVARRINVLEEAVKQIEDKRASPSQRIHYVSADLTTSQGCTAAITEATERMSCPPDYVFLCAGGAMPKFYLDHSPEDFESSMKLNYLSAVWTAQEAAKLMVARDRETATGVKKGGKIVFISSTLGMLNFIGYSVYSPTKFALRGLAEGLRNELKPHDIDVHIYFPGNIDTPGFVEENKTKPTITRHLEGVDPPLHPAKAAKALMTGVKNNQFAITSDFISDAVRCSTKAAMPGNGMGIYDWIIANIAFIVLPIVRMIADREVKRYANIQEHKAD